MKDVRTKIYIKVSPEKNEIEYSGMEFAEFIKYLSQQIENILLLKGDYFGNRCESNFELLEGKEIVERLAKEDVHSFGDFSFVDYSSPQNVNGLSGEQIAELLYLGHMFKPLRSPFFNSLHNNFAYLAHDDGWYCKLYCKNLYDFITVLCKKVAAHTSLKSICEPSDSMKEAILQMATSGLLIDLEESSCNPGGLETKLYIIGSYSDMDTVLNNYQKLKESATQIHSLHCNETEWSISQTRS